MKTLTTALAVTLLTTASAFAYCGGSMTSSPQQTVAETVPPLVLPGQAGS